VAITPFDEFYAINQKGLFVAGGLTTSRQPPGILAVPGWG